jgi:glutaredoxin
MTSSEIAPNPAHQGDAGTPAEGKKIPKIRMFTLSTCIHCKRAKAFFQQRQVPFEFLDVDLLQGKEKESVLEEVGRYNPELTFPTILIGGEVIVGFNEERLKRALGS